MSTSVVMGLGAAMMLFWAIGAYNRLVRLRSEVAKAFSSLDNILSVQSALIQASVPASMMRGADGALSDADVQDGMTAEWQRLSAAGEQLSRSLARARSRPLDPEAIAALSSAQSVLAGLCPQVASQVDGDAVAGMPVGLQTRLAHLADQLEVPANALDAAVGIYNAAIRQFPALLLARVWGFKPAGCFRPPAPIEQGV